MKRIRLRRAGLLVTPVLVVGLAASSPSTAMAWIGRIGPLRQEGCRPEVAVPPQSHSVVLEPGANPLRLSARVTLPGWTGGRAGDSPAASVTGLPAGVAAEVVPDRPVPSSPSGAVTVTTVLTTRAGAEEGTYSLRLEVRCGDASASGVLPLRLLAPAPPGGLGVVPSEATLLAGDVTGFCLRQSPVRSAARRPRPAAAPQAPYAVAGLPPEAEASFRPGHRTDPGCTRLTVRTAPGTPAGDYPLTVTATTRHGRAGARVLLHVRDQQALPFSVTGSLPDGLWPGRTLPLDVTVDNPNPTPIRVSKLSVMITGLDAGRAARCPVEPNFAVTPFTGDYSAFVVPAGGQASLSGLGLPPATWPQVSLLDTGTDQTPCLGAVPRLMFTGTADPTAG